MLAFRKLPLQTHSSNAPIAAAVSTLAAAAAATALATLVTAHLAVAVATSRSDSVRNAAFGRRRTGRDHCLRPHGTRLARQLSLLEHR